MQAFFAHFQVPAYAFRAAPHMVTQEELRLVRAFLPGQVFSASEAAEALALAPEAAEELLRTAYRSQVIRRDGDGWVLTDFYTRLFAFCREQPEAWQAMDRSTRATLSEWALEEYIVKHRLHTAEPNRRDVVLTLQEALALLAERPVIGLSDCLCSTLLDGPERETCFSFGDGPNTELDRGSARRITPAEAQERLRTLYGQGRILIRKGDGGLCACRAESCCDLRAALRMGMLGEWPEAPHAAQPGPGEDADRCPLRVLTAEEGRLVPDPDRCVGCGLCGLPLTDR